MKRVRQFFAALSDWITQGMRLPVILALTVVIAVAAVVAVVAAVNRPESDTVTVFVTVRGLEDGKNFENRQIKISDGDAVADIFSLKYKDIYEAFEKPFIQYNEFQSFLGTRKTPEKSFHITIDGKFDSDLSQAYVYGGQTIVISYY